MAAHPKIQHAQTVKHVRLLDMPYKLSEISGELDVPVETIVNTWIPAGLPIVTDSRGHRWINGQACARWIQSQEAHEITPSLKVQLSTEDRSDVIEICKQLELSETDLLRLLIRHANNIFPNLRELSKAHKITVDGRRKIHAHNHITGFLNDQDKLTIYELALSLNWSLANTYRQLIREGKKVLPRLELLAREYPQSLAEPIIYPANRYRMSLNKNDHSTLADISALLNKSFSETICILIRESKKSPLNLQGLAQSHPVAEGLNSRAMTRSIDVLLEDKDRSAIKEMADAMGRSKVEAIRILIRESKSFLPDPGALGSSDQKTSANRTEGITHKFHISLTDNDFLTFGEIKLALDRSTVDTVRILIRENKIIFDN